MGSPGRRLDMKKVPSIKDSYSLFLTGYLPHLNDLAQEGFGPIIETRLRGSIREMNVSAPNEGDHFIR
jgi:hypothetical protein